jgi:intracellular multiplication protein IcmX
MSNVIGTLPTPYSFFSYDYNQQFLSQLNINTLVAPLLYSTTSSTTPSTSSPTPNTQQNSGLPAQNQAQLASDFIRYASGAVAPISLPQQNVYNMLYAQATNSSNNVPLTQQIASQAVLNNYFAKLRAYAAVLSVPYSNLYYIFSKRMPQNTGGSTSSSATSQALNEFTMSTWRLYTPQGQASGQWLNQLNTASSATVQKEIATLLAEINYQLYLTRQQEERILLTNTMLLVLGSHSTQPIAPSLDSLNTSGSSTSQMNNQ